MTSGGCQARTGGEVCLRRSVGGCDCARMPPKDIEFNDNSTGGNAKRVRGNRGRAWARQLSIEAAAFGCRDHCGRNATTSLPENTTARGRRRVSAQNGKKECSG
jgi:hypothetical protein